LAVLLDFKLFDEPLEGFFGRLAGDKANPAQDTAKAASSSHVQLFFLLFNPGKMMLVPDSSQPVKSGNCGSMSA
jgi:hypothetical protein